MEKKHSIKFNALMNLILRCSSLLFPLITYPYVSRVLSPEGMGKVSFATGIISYFSLFALLGVPTYGVKACAQVRDDRDKLSKLVRELMSITVVFAILSYVALTLSLIYIDKMSKERTLFVVCSFQILLNVIGADWVFSALEEYKYITIRSVLFKFIGLVLMFIFVRDKDDYITYAIIVVISSYGSYILNFFRLYRIIDFKKKYRKDYRSQLKYVIVFFFMAAAVSIYTNLDTAMIGFMKDDYSVGIYNTSVKIKTILTMLTTSLGTVLLPRLSYYLSNKQEEQFKAIVKKSISIVLAVSIPAITFFELFAKETILVLSGEEFLTAEIPMRILLFNVLFSSLANITGLQILVPSNHERVYLISVVCGAVLDFFFNLVLIPKYGVVGASFATLIAEIVGLTIQIVYLRKLVFSILSIKDTMQIIFGAFFAIIPIYVLFLNLNVIPIAKMALGFLGYGITLFSILLFVNNNTFIYLADQIRSTFSRVIHIR